MRIGQHNLVNILLGKSENNRIFQVGKIYNVELMKMDGGEALLKYQGKEIQAQLKNQDTFLLKNNGNIRVKIESIQDGKIMMKLLGDSNHGLKDLNIHDLKNLIMDLGLSPSQENISMVQKLLKHQLPVTKENIGNVLYGIKNLQIEDGLKKDMALFLMERKLPFHPVLVGMLTGYFKKKDVLAHHMEGLMEAFEGAEETIGEMLKEYVVSVDDQEDVPLDNKIMETLKKFKNIKEDREEIFESIGKALFEKGESWNRDLKKVFQHLTFQSMINRDDGKGLPYVYYQIPIKWKEVHETMEIFILNQGKNKNTFLKGGFRGVFCIYTEEMGQIKVDVHMNDEKMNLKIGLETQEVLAFIEKYIPILQEQLKKLEFHVSPITCFVDHQNSFQYIEKYMDYGKQKFDIRI